jgi:hypothetical protein
MIWGAEEDGGGGVPEVDVLPMFEEERRRVNERVRTLISKGMIRQISRFLQAIPSGKECVNFSIDVS